MKLKGGQTAIEFMILIGIMLFIFLIFSLILNQDINEKYYYKRNQEMIDLADSVKQEIDIATSSLDGYERNFYVPERILNVEYEITITQNFLFVNTLDNRHAITVPVKSISGNIQRGNNMIKKINGTIFLNS